ncbi:MAG: hypothetical protein IH962_03595 [Chloroflexi bacterium]|nr:hypothetical protein [Chloroflexota bacterium]
MSYRPAGTFRGRPGTEQFVIDKIGEIRLRQLLEAPSRQKPSWLLLAVAGLVVLGLAGLAVAIAVGTFSANGPSPGSVAGIVAPPVQPTPTPSSPTTVAGQQFTAADIQKLITSALADMSSEGRSQLTTDEVESIVASALAGNAGGAGSQLTQAGIEQAVQQALIATPTPLAMEPTPAATPENIPTATVIPLPTSTPVVVVVTATPTPSPTPTATPTPLPTPTPTPTPFPISTPLPTPTPIPPSAAKGHVSW